MPKKVTNKLPSGWMNTKLPNAMELILGQSPASEDCNSDGIGLPFYQGKTEFGKLYPTARKYCTKPKKIALNNDVLLSVRAPVGPTNLASEKCVIGRGLAALRGNKDINFKYLLSYFRHIEPWLSEQGTGTTFKAVSGVFLKELEFHIAPIAEQKRIVDKLDSLLAQVDTIQQRLNNLPDIIKRFRQSVLAAAVSGKLTEQWRGETDYQTTNIGFEIPVSWKLHQIQNIGEVKGGKRLPIGEELVTEDTSYRYVRAGQLKNGTIINGDTSRNRQMYLKAHVQKQIKRYIVNQGDAYITIVGASIGDAGVVPANYDGANLTENAAKICEFSRPMNSDFIGYWLRSQLIQQLIMLEIKSGAQGKLALKRIKTLPIPNITIEEQTEIVRLVEQHFALADTLEKNLKNAKQRVDNLTQSILAKAFRGELVPQDPNDEPAEHLLARIKAARAEAELIEKAAKKVSKNNKS